MLDLLAALNPPQREAATTVDGPLLVIAGAGSGKTRVITYRIAYLLRECGVGPRNIFAATFTNKAAKEMRERVFHILERPPSPYLAINTFHALCAVILRQQATLTGLSSKFVIADERDSLTAMRDALKHLDIPKEELQPSQALWVVSQCKLRLLGPESVADVITSPVEELYRAAFEEYQKRLRAADAVDFDDLIGYVVRIFEENPEVLAEYQDRFRYILVDEYQDTNHSQFRLVSLMAGAHKNICVVGDEDQSIYSWRGADLDNLLDFQRQYPGARLVKLEQNYRSTGTVLAAADAVIAHNTERIGKTLWTELGGGHPVVVINEAGDFGEADRICELIASLVERGGMRYSDIALFYRVNSLSRLYEDRLRAHDIPYQVIGGPRFYDRMEIRDMVAYLQFAVNPHSTMSLLRIVNTPRRGVGQKTLDQLMADALRAERSLFAQILLALDDGSIKGRARAALELLASQVTEWMKVAAEDSPTAVLKRILADTAYTDALGDPKSLDVRSRIDNLEQLRDALTQYEDSAGAGTLADWLENIALASAQDDMAGDDVVSLMTLHTAKGLEFPAVFIAGMEDPIFPNRRSADERGDIEEERRLFYVGITRAMRLLVLSRAESRVLHGELRFNPPSPFLLEVPTELMVPCSAWRPRDIAQLAKPGEGPVFTHTGQLASAAPRSSGERSPHGDARAAEEARVQAVLKAWAGDTSTSAMTREDGDPGGASSAPRTPNARHAAAMAALAQHTARRPPVAIGGRRAKPAAGAARDDGDPLAWAQLGARVIHETFGAGRIVGLSGAGPDRKFLIEFEDEERRQYEMVARYARLKPG